MTNIITMKTIVYHYQEDSFTGNREFVQIGTVVGNDITPEVVRNIANWACWVDDAEYYKIKYSTADLPVYYGGYIYNRTHSDIGYTNHDIMFKLDGVWYTAESFGFAKFDTYDEAKQHLIETNH